MEPKGPTTTDRRTHQTAQVGTSLVPPSAVEHPSDELAALPRTADVKPSTRELVDTPVWCITIRQDCTARAEEIVEKIRELLGASKDDASSSSSISQANNHRYLIECLTGRAYRWPGPAWQSAVVCDKIEEIRALLVPDIQRDRTAVSRLRIQEDLFDNRFDKAIEAISVLLAEKAFFDTRESLAQPFVTAVAKEAARQELLLKTLNVLASDEPDLSPRTHFEDMAIGLQRLLTNRPLIGPDIWGDREIQAPSTDSLEHPVLNFMSRTNRKIAGGSFRFGFFVTHAQLTKPEVGIEGPYKIVHPLISLDEKVFTVLTEMGKSSSSTSESTADERGAQIAAVSLRILKGIRDLAALGGHDTWHHLFYGLKLNPLDRLAFTSIGTYFYQTSFDEDAHRAFALKSFDLNDNGFPYLENHAYLSHRAIWRELTTSTKLSDGVIRRLGNFVADLAELKDDLISRVGDDEALRVVKYLTTVAFDQVALLLPYASIVNMHTLNRNGDTLDEALVRLGIPSYDLRSKEVSELASSLVPQPILVSAILKTALDRGTSTEVSTEILDVTKRLYNLSEPQLDKYQELRPLFTMLILLDLSSHPHARRDLSTLVERVHRARGGAKAPTVKLEIQFKRIATHILGKTPTESPPLTMNEHSAKIFTQAARECLRSRRQKSLLHRDLLTQGFAEGARRDPIFLEALLSVRPLSIEESPHDIDRHLFRRLVDEIRASQDHKLSGLRALMAEQFFSDPRRVAWIDACERLDPIQYLHRLQRTVAKVHAENPDRWRETRDEFEHALDSTRRSKNE